jgi:hypothetical protein
VQGGLKHHHERSVEAVAQLPDRVTEHQSLFHGSVFVETNPGTYSEWITEGTATDVPRTLS